MMPTEVILSVDFRSGVAAVCSSSKSFPEMEWPVSIEKIESVSSNASTLLDSADLANLDRKMREIGIDAADALLDEAARATLRQIVASTPIRLVYAHAADDQLAWRFPVEWLSDEQAGVIAVHDAVWLSRRAIGTVSHQPARSLLDRPVMLWSWAASHIQLSNPLDIGAERRHSERDLKLHRADSVVIHRLCPSASLEALQHVTYKERDNPFNVWHHAGHGKFAKESQLRLHDNLDGMHDDVLITGAALKQAGLLQPGLELVFFNVCHSAREGGLVRAAIESGVSAAVGHLHAIADPAAIQFSRVFWQELQRSPLDAAVSRARRTLRNTPIDWGLPVIYATDPDLTIFPSARNSNGELGLDHGKQSRNRC